MAGLVSEPSKLYWALGIAASLGLHATGVAGAVLLADRFVAAPVSTEITFTEDASPVATPVAAETETATPAETATVAAAETVAPETIEVAKPETEALQPVQPEAVVAGEQERLSPSSTVEAAVKPDAASAEPVASTEVASAAVPANQSVSSAETATSLPAEPTNAAASDALPPVSVAESAEQGSAETLTATSGSTTVTGEEPEAISVGDAEPLSAAPAESGSSAESVAALDASSEAVTGVVAAEPSASTAEIVSGSTTEVAPSAGSEAVASASADVVSGSSTETVSPVASSEPSDGAAPTLVPETAAPVTGAAGDTGDATTVPPAVTETAPVVEQPVQTALLVPARPDSSLGTEVDKPSDRYRRIVDFIRTYEGGDCFIALPAMSAAGDVTFQTFGRDKDREAAFRQALLGLDGLNAEISSGNVADPQCMALRFAEHARRYPGFSLMIDLDEADVASGTKLSGAVLNANGRDLHLLLVDDEGQVQSMDQVMSPGNGVDRPFSTPLTLTGGPVVTKQILIAITSDRELPLLKDFVRARAAAFFRKLAAEIDASGADIDLAVEGFSVN